MSVRSSRTSQGSCSLPETVTARSPMRIGRQRVSASPRLHRGRPARVPGHRAHVALDHERRLRACAIRARAALDARVDRHPQLGPGRRALLGVRALERRVVVGPCHRPPEVRAAVAEARGVRLGAEHALQPEPRFYWSHSRGTHELVGQRGLDGLALEVQLAKRARVLDRPVADAVVAAVQHERPAVDGDRPRAQVVRGLVAAVPEIGRALRERRMRQQVDLVADARAVGAGDDAGVRGGQRPERRAAPRCRRGGAGEREAHHEQRRTSARDHVRAASQMRPRS